MWIAEFHFGLGLSKVIVKGAIPLKSMHGLQKQKAISLTISGLFYQEITRFWPKPSNLA